MTLVKLRSSRIFGTVHFALRPKTLYNIVQCILLFQKPVVRTDETNKRFCLASLIFKLKLIARTCSHRKVILPFNTSPLSLDRGSVAGVFNVELSVSVALMDEVKGVSPWAFPSSNAQAKRKALTITNQQAKTHPEAFPHLLIFSGKWIHVIYFHTQEYFFASNRLSALKCCEFPLESFSSVKG